MSLPTFNNRKVMGFLLKNRIFNKVIFSIYENLNKYVSSLIQIQHENNFKVGGQEYSTYVYDDIYVEKDFYLNLILWDVLRYTEEEDTFSYSICFEKTHGLVAHKIYDNLNLDKSRGGGIGEILIFKYIKKEDEVELFSVDEEDQKFLYNTIYPKKRKIY